MLLSSSCTLLTVAACRPCGCSSSNRQNRSQQFYSRSATAFGSCRPVLSNFNGSSLSKSRRRTISTPATAVTDIPLIQSEEDFTHALTQNKVIVVDWMARWCRKCIYLKPKIQKMMEEEFPDLPIVYIDVNAVPGKLVYGNGIKKMPTIALYQNNEKIAEHIAAEGGKDAVAKIKTMIESNLNASEVSQQTAG